MQSGYALVAGVHQRKVWEIINRWLLPYYTEGHGLYKVPGCYEGKTGVPWVFTEI
jgi:hypothetical protein